MVPMAAVKKDAPIRKRVKRAATVKKAVAKTPQQRDEAAKKPRVFGMSFASVYPLYVQKAEKKGRTQAEVDEIILWLTGYGAEQLQRVIASKLDFETFLAEAPRMNPNVALIQGVVCGVRVEDVADPLMQKIRYLDKLIDELARGKPMASILRQ